METWKRFEALFSEHEKKIFARALNLIEKLTRLEPSIDFKALIEGGERAILQRLQNPRGEGRNPREDVTHLGTQIAFQSTLWCAVD